MDRREFFKTLGVPALLVPFFGKMQLFSGDKKWNGYPEIGEWEYTPAIFACVESQCSQCSRSHGIPYVSGPGKKIEEKLDITIPCRCGGEFKFDQIISIGGVKAYWREE